MSLVYSALTAADAEKEGAKIQVGIVGSANDTYIKWGLAAMQFDSSALSVKKVSMEENAARAALEKGEIAAYVVFPENFVENAMSGDVGKLRLVSTVGAVGLVAIVKEEVTVLVDKILASCENGSFGVGDALDDNALGQLSGDHINGMALEYVDFLFDRSKMYRVENLSQNSPPFAQYMLGGLSVLLILLWGLPFAPLLIRKDLALEKVLRARRIGTMQQVLGEFTAFFLALTVLLAGMALVLRHGGLLPEEMTGWRLFWGALPTVLMAAALCYCLYTLSNQLIGGVLLTFFVVLALGFAGGCMYPVQVFPMGMQRLAAILPTGIARQSLTACFLGETPTGTAALLGFGCGFLALAMMLRHDKTARDGR